MLVMDGFMAMDQLRRGGGDCESCSFKYKVWRGQIESSHTHTHNDEREEKEGKKERMERKGRGRGDHEPGILLLLLLLSFLPSFPPPPPHNRPALTMNLLLMTNRWWWWGGTNYSLYSRFPPHRRPPQRNSVLRGKSIINRWSNYLFIHPVQRFLSHSWNFVVGNSTVILFSANNHLNLFHHPLVVLRSFQHINSSIFHFDKWNGRGRGYGCFSDECCEGGWMTNVFPGMNSLVIRSFVRSIGGCVSLALSFRLRGQPCTEVCSSFSSFFVFFWRGFASFPSSSRKRDMFCAILVYNFMQETYHFFGIVTFFLKKTEPNA